MHNEILCLLHFCRPGFLTIHIPPWSSMDLQVLRIGRSQRLDMGLKRVSWVRRYQGQCRALRPLGHRGYRLRSYKEDLPLCSGYSRAAARCAARCCAVVCCVVLIRSVGAAACCAVPSGAARRPGVLCFLELVTGQLLQACECLLMISKSKSSCEQSNHCSHER